MNGSDLDHDGRKELSQEALAAGFELEEAEEAKVAGIDGHAEVAGRPEANTDDDLDELVDGSSGTSESGDETIGAEVYFETADGEQADSQIDEVEGFDPVATAFEHGEYGPEVIERIFGDDDRVRVGNTSSYPWRTMCKLEITARNGSRLGCSGAMIGPRTVLTNGHCVYLHDHGGWAQSIRVIPGMNGSSEPFGAATSSTYWSVKGWTERRSSNYDYAVIVLPSSEKLGNAVGWMGMARLSYLSLMGLRVNNSGYPGDKPYGTQWWNANNVLAVTPRRLYYRLDTYFGQSGSPLWRLKDGNRHIVAVHNTGGSAANGSVRLSKSVFDNLVKWKNEYT
jgi:glutamyl endopeptidase